MPWKKVEYKGKSYEMIKSLAQEYDVDCLHLRKLLKSGWSVDDAMEICIKQVYGIDKLYKYEGKLYRSPRKLAEEYKLPESSLRHFLARCDSVEEAMKRCREEQEKQIVLWGKKYKSRHEVAQKFGINYGSIAYETNFKKESLETAVLKLLQKEPVIFENKVFPTIIDLCAEYGTQPSNVLERLRYGKTLEEAVYTPIRESTRGTSVVYEDVIFPSQVELCRTYNISKLLVSGLKRYAEEKNFIECFQLVRQLRDECEWPENKTFAFIPVLKIENTFYKKIPEFAQQAGLSGGQICTYKSSHCCEDTLQALQWMQKETIIKYKTPYGAASYREAAKMGYQFEEIKKLPQITVPRYPGLQKYDLTKDCMDIQQRYRELFGKKPMVRKKNEPER